MSAAAWDHHFGRAVDAVGRYLRRHPDADDYDRMLIARIGASLDALDALLEPCAADLVREGLSVEEALQVIDRHVDELRARLGGRP